jgi:rhamnose transport system permease protein
MIRFVLLIALVAFAVFSGSRFAPDLTPGYLLSSSTLYMEVGLLALAMTLIIASGNIDLSVGSNLVLTACITAKLLDAGLGPALAIPAAMAVGTGLGLVNGLLVAYGRLPSFLVTLATMAIYAGAASALMGASSIKLPKSLVGLDMAEQFGIPWPLIIFVGFAGIFGAILHGTVMGRRILAMGANESASRYSGLPLERLKLFVFAAAGCMAGIGAMMLNSRLGVARHDIATGMELDVITVVVVGGTSITGGKGSILGTSLALALIVVFRTAMGVANVKAEYQLPAIGALLIAAVLIGRIKWKR